MLFYFIKNHLGMNMKYLIIIVSILFSTITSAQDVNLSWVPPSEREDNTSLQLTEIASFRIYYGVVSGVYQNSITVSDGAATSYAIRTLPDGVYYFVMTTIDTDGRESTHSAEISVNLITPPTELAPPKTVQSFTISQTLPQLSGESLPTE